MKKNNKKILKIVLPILILIILIIIVIFINRKRVSYKITYNGLNCPTPFVVFYENGRYKYYEHYGIGEKAPRPSNGKYEYDMDNLIKNINNYEEDRMGPYTIKVSNGNEYTTYSSNKELRELLDENNIVLEKCMTQEDE